MQRCGALARCRSGSIPARSGAPERPASGGGPRRFRNEEDQKTAWGAVFPTNAVQLCLTLKVIFGLPLRRTVGPVESLIRIAGLDWPVPDYSTLCRRQARIGVKVPYRRSGKGPFSLDADLRNNAKEAPPCFCKDSAPYSYYDVR